MNIEDNKKPQLFGVSRSGGTFIYNIINEIFNGNAQPQSHKFFTTERKVIATYRDFRDSTVSWWRMEVGQFDNEDNIKTMSKRDIVYYADRMRGRIYELDKMKAHYPEEQILFLCYEEFFNNFDFIFHNIENFLDIQIAPELKETIVQKYNLSAQKKESEKFEDFRGYDQVRHIHGHHIMNGRPQTWMKLTDPKHYFLLNYILKDGLNSWGYKKNE